MHSFNKMECLVNSSVGRLLTFHQGALGDFVVAFPVLKALRKSFSRIDAVCRSSLGRLAVVLDILDHCYPVESARFSSLFSDTIDPGLIALLSDYTDILLISFSDIPEQSIGKIEGLRVFRIAPWPPPARKIHVTTYLTEQVMNSGLLGKTEGQRLRDDVRSLGVSSGLRLPQGAGIIISPGAGSHKKRWPLERFLFVADQLAVKKLRPMILLGPAEADIAAALKNNRGFYPPVVTSETYKDLVTILKSASGYIGNDSGTAHLAAFLGLPTLVIFGPSDPDRWRPFGPDVAVVNPSAACSPCFEDPQVHCRERACLEEVTGERVVSAAARLFGL